MALMAGLFMSCSSGSGSGSSFSYRSESESESSLSPGLGLAGVITVMQGVYCDLPIDFPQLATVRLRLTGLL